VNSVGRWLTWTLAIAAAAIVLVLGWYAAHILWWRDHAPGETAFMAMRAAEQREHGKPVRRSYQWVPYERISPALKRAMIAAEDAKFVEHEGFDWEGIERAMDKNQRRGRVVAGGSTITQQLAKNLFLDGERTFARKVREAAIAVGLEATLTKRRILEVYLNVAEWGPGLWGIGPASRRYFGVSAKDLDTSQAARLAAMAPNPRYYERHPDARGLERKIPIIMARMPAAELP